MYVKSKKSALKIEQCCEKIGGYIPYTDIYLPSSSEKNWKLPSTDL